MDQKDFANTIKNKRIKKGLSQSQLGKLLNVSNKTISKWENGRGYPDITMLTKITTTLDLSYEQILLSNEYLVAKKKRKQKIMILVTVITLLIGVFTYLMINYQNKLINDNISKDPIVRLTNGYYKDGYIMVYHHTSNGGIATPDQLLTTQSLVVLNDYLNISSFEKIKTIKLNQSVPDDLYLDEDLQQEDRYTFHIKKAYNNDYDLIITLLDNNQVAIRDNTNNQAIIYRSDNVDLALQDIDLFTNIKNK